MSTPDEFIFSLLSDSTQIIDKFSCLDTVNLLWGQYEPSYQEAKFKPSKDDPRFRTHAVQAVLRNDWKDYNEIKAVTIPFQNVTFNYSERFKKILQNAGMTFDMEIRDFEEDQ